MNCIHCGKEVILIEGLDKDFFIHADTKKETCEMKVKAEPLIKHVGSFICKDWNNCIHGAGCTLSTFKFEESKKKDPVLIFENGEFHCQTWKKG